MFSVAGMLGLRLGGCTSLVFRKGWLHRVFRMAAQASPELQQRRISAEARLGAARACLGAAKALEMAARACLGVARALEMSARACCRSAPNSGSRLPQCRRGAVALNITARRCCFRSPRRCITLLCATLLDAWIRKDSNKYLRPVCDK